ncbi:MAG: hypothetical protein ACREGH_03075 [Minisyncoccia bacterium]
MLTDGQRNYLSKIPKNQKVVVKPFNPKSLEIVDEIISGIKVVEPDLEVECAGSVPLRIAGQEDIDINVYCIKQEQERHLENLKRLFGEPSHIGRAAIAWDFARDGYSIEVWLTDPTAETTKAQIQGFRLLKENAELLKEYEAIKLAAKDLSYIDYQTKKYEFYNRILGLEDTNNRE